MRTRQGLHPTLAYVVDLVLVVLFATIGRRSHDEAGTLAGIWGTTWPFLVGATVGWGLAWWVRRVPPISAHDGVLVWLSTVAVGMALRVVTGAGTHWSFILVALAATAVFLLGWRYVADRMAARESA